MEAQIAQKQPVLSGRQCNALSVAGSQGETAEHRKFTTSHWPKPVHKMNDEVDLTQFSRISHPGKAFWRGHFTENTPSISRSTSIFLVKINVGQERTTGMESILTFSKSALTRLLSVPVFGSRGCLRKFSNFQPK